MQLLSQESQFAVQLPSDFYPQDLEQEFKPFLDNERVVYSSLQDYMNAQIRSISIPGYSYSVEEQALRYGKMQGYQPAQHDQQLINRSMSIDFKDVDANIAYLIAQRMFLYHYNNSSVNNQHLGPIVMFTLDARGDAVFRVRFKQTLLTGISDKSYNFASQQIADKSFTLNFYYNFIEVDFLLTGEDDSLGDDLLLREIIPDTYE